MLVTVSICIYVGRLVLYVGNIKANVSKSLQVNKNKVVMYFYKKTYSLLELRNIHIRYTGMPLALDKYEDNFICTKGLRINY